jgi:hypothetical protein
MLPSIILGPIPQTQSPTSQPSILDPIPQPATNPTESTSIPQPTSSVQPSHTSMP